MLMPHKKISIVIPNFNGENFLPTCLSSIYKQSYKNFEIIIIDNGSNDNSETVCRQYNDVKFIKLNSNYGFSKAVNQGIINSSGELIFLLNNDTELDEKCLEQINIFFENNDVDTMACRMIYYFQKDSINSAGDLYSIFGIATSIGKGENINNLKFNSQKRVFSACAGAAVYKKELFDEIGYFDEDYFAYMEDVDFGFRANLLKKICVYNPLSIVYHVHGGTSKKMYDFVFYHSAKNTIITIIKDIPLVILLILFIPLIIGQVGTIASGIKHGKLSPLFKAYFYVLKNFSKTIKKRKFIQNTKKISNYDILNLMEKKYPLNIKKFFTGK